MVQICKSKLCNEQTGHTVTITGLTPTWLSFVETLPLFYKPNPLIVVSVFRTTERLWRWDHGPHRSFKNNHVQFRNNSDQSIYIYVLKFWNRSIKLLQFLLNIQKKSHDDNKPKNYSLLFMHINTTRLEWNILRAVTLYNKQVLGTNFTSTWKIENLSMYLHVHLIIFR